MLKSTLNIPNFFLTKDGRDFTCIEAVVGDHGEEEARQEGDTAGYEEIHVTFCQCLNQTLQSAVFLSGIRIRLAMSVIESLIVRH